MVHNENAVCGLLGDKFHFYNNFITAHYLEALYSNLHNIVINYSGIMYVESTVNISNVKMGLRLFIDL